MRVRSSVKLPLNFTSFIEAEARKPSALLSKTKRPPPRMEILRMFILRGKLSCRVSSAAAICVVSEATISQLAAPVGDTYAYARGESRIIP